MNSNPDQSDLTTINVLVPAPRIAEFYEMFGRWLAGRTETGLTNTGGTVQNWADTDEDLALAQEMWRKFTPSARRLFSCFLDAPGSTFSGEKLAADAEIEKGIYGVAGVLAWPGRYCIDIHRSLPVEATPQQDGGSSDYTMLAGATAVFTKARATT